MAKEKFEDESLYNIQLSKPHDSEKYRTVFRPMHKYKVKGKVAKEIQEAGALKSSKLAKQASDLKTSD